MAGPQPPAIHDSKCLHLILSRAAYLETKLEYLKVLQRLWEDSCQLHSNRYVEREIKLTFYYLVDDRVFAPLTPIFILFALGEHRPRNIPRHILRPRIINSRLILEFWGAFQYLLRQAEVITISTRRRPPPHCRRRSCASVSNPRPQPSILSENLSRFAFSVCQSSGPIAV